MVGLGSTSGPNTGGGGPDGCGSHVATPNLRATGTGVPSMIETGDAVRMTRRSMKPAWRGGPRLVGELGSPEFIASYNEAVRRKVTPPAGTVFMLQRYQGSPDYLDLADSTRRDYGSKIVMIERKFGTFRLAALSDPRTRGIFLEWRDEIAASGRRNADYTVAVFARVLSWALDRGLVTHNPLEKAGRLYRGSRADKIWSVEDEVAFLRRAPAHLHLPLVLALWTGQRQGDLLRLPWSGYDGTHIRLRQRKGGLRVTIPVGAPLRTLLDAAAKAKKGPIILVNSDDKPWTSDGFRSSWRKACAKAGIVGVRFHDLRGTAVTRLAIAGCTEAEIATITGHSLRDVRSILDANYLHRDQALAENAIRKLERGTDLQTKPQTGR